MGDTDRDNDSGPALKGVVQLDRDLEEKPTASKSGRSKTLDGPAGESPDVVEIEAPGNLEGVKTQTTAVVEGRVMGRAHHQRTGDDAQDGRD